MFGIGAWSFGIRDDLWSGAGGRAFRIRIDWATYNPVSLVLKNDGLLEKEFSKDGIKVTWVQSAGSNKALEFLNASSLDFGSTAVLPLSSGAST